MVKEMFSLLLMDRLLSSLEKGGARESSEKTSSSCAILAITDWANTNDHILHVGDMLVWQKRGFVYATYWSVSIKSVNSARPVPT